MKMTKITLYTCIYVCEKTHQDSDNCNMFKIIRPYQLLEYDICPKKHYQCLIC